ncbi:MAG: ATP-binding cassette domain-containing protein [Clostridiales bacterium]|nr:ATP-binding cassette domain-containing protein [Clostridiales bacterium]
MKLDHVSKSYQGRTVLRDFSLELPDRGFCCILGPSGAGKTTLLRLMAGLEQPDSGTVTVSAPVSMVFQEDRLLAHDTVLENAALAADPQRAKELLVRLGLEEWLFRRPAALSGGMRRRVAIARALAAPAGVYLMDEPLKGLDRDTKQAVLSLIRDETRNGLLVLVTHDPEEARGADQIVTVEPLNP